MKNTTILKIVGISAFCVVATVCLTFAFNEVLKHDEPLVYVTRTGEKYHSDGCVYLRSSCIPIGQEEAESKGYTPCLRCGGESCGTVTVNSYGLSFCISVFIVGVLFLLVLLYINSAKNKRLIGDKALD